MAKEGDSAAKIVEEMGKNDDKGESIDKIHFGKFKQFGVAGGEQERGNKEEE